MPLIPYSLARPFLFGLDPEAAHDLTLQMLARGQGTPLQCGWSSTPVHDPLRLAGLEFPNRVGLAAGSDKNARRKAQALINRLGFNNDGLDAFIANVQRARCRQPGQRSAVLLGLNIGKNASTPIENATADYLSGLEGVYPHADYVAVNISSPNTQNLRALQSDAALDGLLEALAERRERLAAQSWGRRVPLFVKIAPDLDETQVRLIAAALKNHGMDGVIATNTTISRDKVQGLPHAQETGGLSGAPVREASNRVVSLLRAELGKAFPIIGVGGILSAADAVEKIRAGADVVQIYTGLIYQGPALVNQAARAIQAARA